jgi:hypothetical protein
MTVRRDLGATNVAPGTMDTRKDSVFSDEAARNVAPSEPPDVIAGSGCTNAVAIAIIPFVI